MRTALYVSYVFMCLMLSTTAASAKRIALVIGNGDYENTVKLRNPTNDAQLMSKTLKSLGFEVLAHKDLTQKQMKRAISNFTGRLRSGGSGTIGLVFYAGHAVQVEGRNFLLPVDANIQGEGDVAIEAIRADDLLFGMKQARNRINIVLLDACRDNPYAGQFRSATRGLARLDAPEGSFVAYSTAPGDKAFDGDGKNSPFTLSLAKHMQSPGLTIERVLKLVSRDVKNQTNNRQRPWRSTDLDEDFYPAGVPKTAQQSKGTQVAVGIYPETPQTSSEQRLSFEPEMVRIPGGTFKMGCVSGKSCFDSEKPVRSVTIKSFEMGKYEVTRDQFQAFVDATGHKTGNNCWVYEDKWVKKSGLSFRNPGFTQTGEHPVVCVSWDDATAYADWLSKETGKKYRLPSEAEWEYAARAKSQTQFSFGNKDRDLCDYANGADKSTSIDWKNKSCSDGVGTKTAQVGRYKANAFGLHDMHGNVWEWTQDCLHKTYKWAPKDGTAWLEANGGDCAKRVLRGGSLIDNPQGLRSAVRFRDYQDSRSNIIGFRLSRTLR